MTPTGIKERVVTERASWIEEMLRGIGALPLDSYEEFVGDPRNVAAADSYVRRALEALMDLGRHILAKGLGRVATEYRDVARQLDLDMLHSVPAPSSRAIPCSKMRRTSPVTVS